MYKVKLKQINSTVPEKTIHDEKHDVNVLYNAVVNIEVNRAGTFTFTMAPNHPYYDDITVRGSLVDVYHDANIIFSGIVMSTSIDFYKQKKITCEGIMTLFNDTVQRPASHSGTVTEVLTELINNHNSQVGVDALNISIGYIVTTDSVSFDSNMTTTMADIQKLIDATKCSMMIRKNAVNGQYYVDYLKEPINNSKQTVRIGSNLMSFNKNKNLDDICTRLIPLGKSLENPTIKGERLTISSVNSGCDYLLTGLTNSTIIYATAIFDDIDDAATLKAKAQEYIQSMIAENICINVKAFDLSISSDAFECFKLFDNVRIISTPHGIDAWYPLTKMKIDINQPSKNTITLGEEINKTISELVQ